MKCLFCPAVELIHDARDIPYTYKNESTVIPEVTGDFCPACGESVLESTESRRVSMAMLEFNKQVNASIVDPSFLVLLRTFVKNYHLISGKQLRFLVVVSIPSYVMRMVEIDHLLHL